MEMGRQTSRCTVMGLGLSYLLGARGRPGTMGARSRSLGTIDRPDSRQKAPLRRIAANTRKITRFAVTSFRIDKTAHVPPHALIQVGGLRAGSGVTRSSSWAVAFAPRGSLASLSTFRFEQASKGVDDVIVFALGLILLVKPPV
jgi:hypothetical protein